MRKISMRFPLWMLALLSAVSLACDHGVPTRVSPLPPTPTPTPTPTLTLPPGGPDHAQTIAVGEVVHSRVGLTSARCAPPDLHPGDPFGENPDHCVFYSLAVPRDGTLVIRVEPGTDLFLMLDRGLKVFGTPEHVELQFPVRGGVTYEIQVGFRHRITTAQAFTLTTVLRSTQGG